MIIHDVAALEAVLARHLDPAQAQLARSLLRPGIHLVAAGPGDAVVGRLGGATSLPAVMCTSSFLAPDSCSVWSRWM